MRAFSGRQRYSILTDDTIHIPTFVTKFTNGNGDINFKTESVESGLRIFSNISIMNVSKLAGKICRQAYDKLILRLDFDLSSYSDGQRRTTRLNAWIKVWPQEFGLSSVPSYNASSGSVPTPDDTRQCNRQQHGRNAFLWRLKQWRIRKYFQVYFSHEQKETNTERVIQV